jgi:hypothetical protein
MVIHRGSGFFEKIEFQNWNLFFSFRAEDMSGFESRAKTLNLNEVIPLNKFGFLLFVQPVATIYWPPICEKSELIMIVQWIYWRKRLTEWIIPILNICNHSRPNPLLKSRQQFSEHERLYLHSKCKNVWPPSVWAPHAVKEWVGKICNRKESRRTSLKKSHHHYSSSTFLDVLWN